LLGRDYKPLSPAHGAEKPREVAVIDEARCIGCTLCIQACPVDAIVGAPKQMHTVIAAQCTGCELCVPPCPVDCIAMAPVAAETPAPWPWSPAELARWQAAADAARARYEFRQFRLAREAEEKAGRLRAKLAVKLAEKQAENHASMSDMATPTALPAAAGKIDKAALIAAALERARAQRAQAQPKNTTDLTAEQQAEIAAIDARRAQEAMPSDARQK
jgi:electron transport complex protein RnfB